MPHDDGSTTRDVERVFGALLRNLDAQVAGIDNLLGHTFHLVAQDNGGFLLIIDNKVLKSDAVMHLLDAADAVTVLFELIDAVECSGVVLPVDRLLGAKGGLVNFGLGRLRSDTAQTYTLDEERVGRGTRRPYGTPIPRSSRCARCQALPSPAIFSPPYILPRSPGAGQASIFSVPYPIKC